MRVFMVERNLLSVQRGNERTIRKTSALCRNALSRTPPSDVYIVFRTFQIECPFIIRLKNTDSGQKLFVKSMNSEHNHEIDKVRQYCNSLCR